MVVSQTSVHVRDVVTGVILVHSFNMHDPVCDVAPFLEIPSVGRWNQLRTRELITTLDTETSAPYIVISSSKSAPPSHSMVRHPEILRGCRRISIMLTIAANGSFLVHR